MKYEEIKEDRVVIDRGSTWESGGGEGGGGSGGGRMRRGV